MLTSINFSSFGPVCVNIKWSWQVRLPCFIVAKVAFLVTLQAKWCHLFVMQHPITCCVLLLNSSCGSMQSWCMLMMSLV
jgi:hypothetical protein